MYKRDFYYKLEDFVLNSEQNFLILSGPRKCGKTYALKQLERKFKNKINYIDFKTVNNEDDSVDIINKIIRDIRSGEDSIYILDEYTYAYCPMQEMARIADEIIDSKIDDKDIKTKVIFTGSQSKVIGSWGYTAFCNYAIYLDVTFLNYKEWLDWKGIEKVTKDAFEEFCLDAKSFYRGFSTIEAYLRGCIEETIISNSKSYDQFHEIKCDMVTSDKLINVAYLILLKLHSNIKYSSLFKEDILTERITYLYKTIYRYKFDSIDNLKSSIKNCYLDKINRVNSMSYDELKQCLMFLMDIGFITATPVYDDVQRPIYVISELKNIDNTLDNKIKLFDNVNYTFNYPIFYIDIIKDIFGDISNINNNLLGSIYETYIRGLISCRGVLEFRKDNKCEIDFIDYYSKIALEFTVTNKKISDTNFELLPKDDKYTCVLTTKDITDITNGIIRIPFAELLYKLNSGKDVHSIISEYKDGFSCLDRIFNTAINKH